MIAYGFQKSLIIVPDVQGLSFTCSLGQEKFSLDKYIIAIYLSLIKYHILL